MNKKPAAKLAAKRAAWLERTRRALHVSEHVARELLDQERQQGVRLNPLVAPAAGTLDALEKLGWQGESYAWAPDCYTVDAGLEAIRDSALSAAGAVYIQNAASWLPVLALQPQSGEAILDVCAAPGGKASHIAALTGNRAELTVNDNSRPRLAKLRANLERLQADVEYTLYDATRLAKKLDGRQFDKILLDAPCSGEGLMRYSHDKDFATWSVAHIHRLQSLQKQIMLQAWQLLKPGGTLVYSTCTMAPEENEAVVDYLLRKRPDAAVWPLNSHWDSPRLQPDSQLPNRVPAVTEWNGKPFNPAVQYSLRLAPGTRLEAFYVCKLQKLAAQPGDML